jgi:predicted nuclease with TOPRIM domain
MKQLLEQRLKELRAEFESGQKMMADLESKQANLRDTLLRISGAIQVLEELSANVSTIGEFSEQAAQSPEKPAGQKTEMKIGPLE